MSKAAEHMPSVEQVFRKNVSTCRKTETMTSFFSEVGDEVAKAS